MNFFVQFVDKIIILYFLRFICEDSRSKIFKTDCFVYLLFADRENIVAYKIFVKSHLERSIKEHIKLRLNVIAELIAEGSRIFSLTKLSVKELHYDLSVHIIIEKLSEIVNSLIATLACNKKLQFFCDSFFISICSSICKVPEYSFNFVLHFLPI